MDTPSWYWDLRNCQRAIEQAQSHLLNNSPVKAYESVLLALNKFAVGFSAATDECPECRCFFGRHTASSGDEFPACPHYKELPHESLT